jgi:hypothetical protein
MLVLHPGLKLEYFRLHGWEADWIKTAEELVRDEYVSRYEDQVVIPDMKDNGGPDTEVCDGYYLFQ